MLAMRAILRTLGLSTVIGAAALACTADDNSFGDEDYLTPFDAQLNVTGRGKDEAYNPVAAPGELIVDLTQPELLTKLEQRGYHVTQIFGASGRLSNQNLHGASSQYRSFVKSVVDDLNASAPSGLFVVTATDDIPRRFDTRWLTSAYATFDLAGVVLRPDKADTDLTSCGEVRFVHHLRYAKQMASRRIAGSRLPFMLNAVYSIPRSSDGGCIEPLRHWRATSAMQSEASALQALTAGAIKLDNLRFKQLELNAQMVRMTSASRPTTGGYAEYFMRVFRKSGDALALTPLENTPDVPTIRLSPALRADLLAWIKENIVSIDQGTALVPTRFLASRATSVTTLGSSKIANKPFSQLFSASDFRSVSFLNTKLIASPEALLARLDDMSCMGCHQGRSVAGFHFLGEERGALMHPMNALHTAVSPHYRAEVVRRRAFLGAVLALGEPNHLRAMSSAPAPSMAATMGTECVPEASRALFKPNALWSCESGRECKVAVSNDRSPFNMGLCLPPNRAGQNDIAGLPCFGGEIVDAGGGPRSDTLLNPPDPVSCGARTNCAMPKGGSPGGMCLHAECTVLGKELVPGEVCGYGGASFDRCAALGDFGACIADSVKIQGRTACDDNNPCREDYVCQRLEDVSASSFSTSPSRKIGYCTPIYFVFQMRIDGHIAPQ